MNKLGWIAAGGIGTGIAAFALMTVVDAGEPRGNKWDRIISHHDSCGGKVEANGPERHLPWDGSDSVTIATPASVRYRGGEGDDVIVRGAPEVVARIFIRDGVIDTDCRSSNNGNLEITLPGRAFRSLGIAGAGRIVMENIDQADLALNISGSGSIRAEGKSDLVDVSISGSGKVMLGDLAMKTFNVSIAGSGNAEAGPADKADVTIMGSGSVRLLTNPDQVSTSIMGSGQVKQDLRKPAAKKI